MANPPRFFSVTASGTLNTLVAGTITGGTAIKTYDVEPGTLSVLATVDAETENITVTVLWQVSTDNSTYYTMTPVNNAANIVIATGTSGADAAVSKVYPAPDGVMGWPYVRAAVTNAMATGAAADTYSLTTKYVRRSNF